MRWRCAYWAKERLEPYMSRFFHGWKQEKNFYRYLACFIRGREVAEIFQTRKSKK